MPVTDPLFASWHVSCGVTEFGVIEHPKFLSFAAELQAAKKISNLNASPGIITFFN